jgi:pyruvate dehydrogenase E1 component
MCWTDDTMDCALSERFIDDRGDWLESIAYIDEVYGEPGVREIISVLQGYVLRRNIALERSTLNTPYVNSVPLDVQPPYPGNLELERRIENIVRWNAMAMVLQAQDAGSGVGGHIATYASAATMLEVGFNHFFRARTEGHSGDIVMPQPHASPGIYARAYLEGRLSEGELKNFRRELGDGGGLCSYPHPRSMPGFWQMPNASMGLSVPAAIYQARFAKYLEHRGLKPPAHGKIWCFIGDGEADEPEVLGTVNIAARERLDNLILIVNCNLQRLDGPVRGNGKIIQELERRFLGADWNVIKVIWGSGWDVLLAQDHSGELRRRMEECLDGDYQRYSILPGDVQREHWINGNPRLERMMESLSDEEVKLIKRGGQDPEKLYVAFCRARESGDKPTVILVKTVKGDRMGEGIQGRNTAHQKKNLNDDERIQIARAYGIPIDDESARQAQFYRPREDSEEVRYLRTRREALGGYLPSRQVECRSIVPPDLDLFSDILKGSGDRKVSTTMIMVRILNRLLKDRNLGPYVVPIVPDEARTFGMDGLFRSAGIYSPDGQKYTPVDADGLLSYRESKDGQILQEGICEIGAMASFMAAGSAYAVHGLPMIPFYLFYSMFGFQRVGDMIWSCGDLMCRGFLLGGTAGRTTLNGEGLQHQDGHSHVLASTVPNLISYDPAFGYELAIIVHDGIRRMYAEQEDVFYYLTLYNENLMMPELPADPSIVEGILKGAYCYRRSARKQREAVSLLASGAIMKQALLAADQLEKLGFGTTVWSVTSYVELQREAQACERWNRMHPTEPPKRPYVQRLLDGEKGVFVAVSDYMKSLPESIARWIPGHYEVLGTDGYGLSEARDDIRDFFEVSDKWIVRTAVSAMFRVNIIDQKRAMKIFRNLDLDTDKVDPRTRRTD